MADLSLYGVARCAIIMLHAGIDSSSPASIAIQTHPSLLAHVSGKILRGRLFCTCCFRCGWYMLCALGGRTWLHREKISTGLYGTVGFLLTRSVTDMCRASLIDLVLEC